MSISNASLVSRLSLSKSNNFGFIFTGPKASFSPQEKVPILEWKECKPTFDMFPRIPKSSLRMEPPSNAFNRLFSHRRDFCTNAHDDEIKISQEDSSHYKLNIPLKKERCLFYLHGDQTIQNLLDNIKKEDSSARFVSVAVGSVRVAGSTPLHRLLNNDFTLNVDGKKLSVVPVAHEPGKHGKPLFRSSESVSTDQRVEQLKQEIAPLLEQKIQLDQKSSRYANAVIWGGMGFLVAQWSVLARLTWWDFNWDIMEPITYFITFGTAVLGYAYFALSKRDYSFVDLRESILLKKMLKEYTKNNFDVDRYFILEHELNKLDTTALPTVIHQLEDRETVGDKSHKEHN